MLVAGGGGLTLLLQDSPHRSARDSVPLYAAAGDVVAVPGRPVRLCSPLPQPAMYPAPAPSYCDYGVDVEGVDLDALEDRRTDNGVVSGRAQLTGTFVEGTLHVTDQRSPAPGGGADFFVTPPCPAPDGGWPRVRADAVGLVQYKKRHPDAVLGIDVMPVSQDQAVAFVLVVGDTQAAYADLRPRYGDALCIATSRYTRAEFRAAYGDPALTPGVERQIWSKSGYQVLIEGELGVQVQATYETPQLKAAVAKHPAGLVHVEAFLKPVD